MTRCFFFNDTATTEIYTLSLHDALPISRIGKVNARGEWVTSWGSLGSGPGQFDTPHGIAVSPADEIYVADRGNRRIQVFDADGNYIREFTVDVPVDTTRGKIVYGRENPNGTTGSLAPGAPDALCMTPGPNPVLFIGDLYPSRSEEHTSELQSRRNIVCRLLLEKKK